MSASIKPKVLAVCLSGIFRCVLMQCHNLPGHGFSSIWTKHSVSDTISFGHMTAKKRCLAIIHSTTVTKDPVCTVLQGKWMFICILFYSLACTAFKLPSFTQHNTQISHQVPESNSNREGMIRWWRSPPVTLHPEITAYCKCQQTWMKWINILKKSGWKSHGNNYIKSFQLKIFHKAISQDCKYSPVKIFFFTSLYVIQGKMPLTLLPCDFSCTCKWLYGLNQLFQITLNITRSLFCKLWSYALLPIPCDWLLISGFKHSGGKKLGLRHHNGNSITSGSM